MSNAYMPPPPPPPPPTFSGDALQKLSMPATLLMVVGGLYALGGVISLILNLTGMGMGMMGGQELGAKYGSMMSGTPGIFSALISIGLGGFLVYAGSQMKKLTQYPLCMAGSIVAMLPCSCCCLLSLPIGIWSLVLLLKPEIKQAFH